MAALAGITDTKVGWTVKKVVKPVKYSNGAGTKILGTFKVGTVLRVYTNWPGAGKGLVMFERAPPPGGYWSTYVEGKGPNHSAWMADEANILKRMGWTLKSALGPVSPYEASKTGGVSSGGTGDGQSASDTEGQGSEDTVGEEGTPGSSIGMGSEVGPGSTTFKKEELDQYLPTPSQGPMGVPWWIYAAIPAGVVWGAPAALAAGGITWAVTRS